nr:unnamed protein product [Callosobruchus analis]
MTSQLLVPNPKNARLLYYNPQLKFDFRFIPGGAPGQLENIISNNNRWFKICDKGDDTPATSPESKKCASFMLQATVKIRFPLCSGWCTDGTFRAMGLSGQLENIISNNNRWFKICDKGNDTPAPSPESKKCASFILQATVKIRFPLYSG